MALEYAERTAFQNDFEPQLQLMRILIPLAIANIAYRIRLLTIGGAVAAFAVGAASILSSYRRAAMIIAFFVVGNVATHYQLHTKNSMLPFADIHSNENSQSEINGRNQSIKKKEKKTGRDAWQVLATGGLPAAFCLLSTPFLPLADVRKTQLVFMSFISTACGDTLASEIGMISKQTPRLILTLVPVKPGVDGAVTFLGMISSLVGGLVVGMFADSWPDCFICMSWSIIGSALDSALGQFVQSASAIEVLNSVSKDVIKDVDRNVHKELNALVNFFSSAIASFGCVSVEWLETEYAINLQPLMALIILFLLAITWYEPALDMQIASLAEQSSTYSENTNNSSQR